MEHNHLPRIDGISDADHHSIHGTPAHGHTILIHGIDRHHPDLDGMSRT